MLDSYLLIFLVLLFAGFILFIYSAENENNNDNDDDVRQFLINRDKKYQVSGYVDKPLRNEVDAAYPRNELLPNKTFKYENNPDIIRLTDEHQLFNKEAEKKRSKDDRCREMAKKQCQIPRLVTRNDCYLQQAYEAPAPITRNHQLLGTKHGYEQETNNYIPRGKCDCSARAFELCPENETVSESCFYGSFNRCMSHNK